MRTVVYWKWEDEEADLEGVGPVWVDTYETDPNKPVKSDEWDRWVRRSEAKKYADDNGFEFHPDE